MDVVVARSSPARRGARVLLLLAPAVAWLGLLAFGVVRHADPPAVGDPAPDFAAARLRGGGVVSSADLRGRPLVLNFWASWCVPCIEEAASLRRAGHEYAGDVAFVGVDIKDARSDALAFARRHRVDYTLVRDDGSIEQSYGLTGQPETFFIDSDGVVVEHVSGPVPERELYPLLDVLVARDG